MEQQALLVPPAKRVLSQAESLALVQIFLNVSLACIAHARELIPWTSSCFSTRYIDQINLEDQPEGQTLYSTFKALTANQFSEGQEIKVLVHGGHRCADQILDMLEKGVFDALERGHLEGVQVFVTRTSQGELSVLENYHFLFTYEQGRVSSVQLDTTNRSFDLGEVQKSFKAATRALLRSLRDLPRLPARRKLGMTLSYNETCPTLYQPPGFVDKIDFEEGDAQAVCDMLEGGGEDVVGMLEAGHYQVRVTARLSDSEVQDSSIDLEDTEMSKQLQAMQKTSSNHSNNLLSTLKGSTPVKKRRTDAVTPSGKRIKATTSGRPRNTKSTEDFTRARILKRPESLNKSSLLEPVSTHLDDLPTYSPTDTEKSSEEIGYRFAEPKLAELLVHCYAVQSGKSGDHGIVFEPDLLAEGRIKRLSRGTDISCECGSREQSSDMLYCDVCDGWQHKACYGHTAGIPSGISDCDHFCYTCLLFSEVDESGASPLAVVLLRKAVEYITTQTKSGTEFNESFFLTMLKPPCWTKEVINQVLERLVEEGLFARRDGGLFKVRPLRDSDLQTIQGKYTSPLASIYHLYETTVGGKDPVKRTAVIMKALGTYARGRDYTTAEGCEELVWYNEFGDPVLRWGYRAGLSARPQGTNSHFEAETPIRRRKISISRRLISIDSSPSAGSVTSMEESSRRFRNEAGYNTDSTATAE